MRKKNLVTFVVAVVVTFVGYNMYKSYNMRSGLSDLMLANIDALARYELPEVEITCNGNNYTEPGQCWRSDGDCYIFPNYYQRCIFEGYQWLHCTSVCDL